jgi:hypothetical protein
MLGDMRRQGNAQGRAAAEERARAQAQLSAMHLASAGPPGGGPQQYGHGPPMGHQVRLLVWRACACPPCVQCPRVHTKRGAARAARLHAFWRPAGAETGCKRCGPRQRPMQRR